MSDPAPPKFDRGSAAGGCALIVLGLLMAIPSGLCTSFGLAYFGDALWGSGANAAPLVFLAVGAPVLIIGCIAIWLGWRLWQRR